MSLEHYFKKDIEMATSWDDVTLEQLDKIEKVDIKDPFAGAEIVSILSNIPTDDVLAFDLDTFNTLYNKTLFIKNAPRKCIPEAKLKIGDIVYNVTMNTQNMTAGQFLDYKSIMSMDNIDKKLARLMLCFMIPEGHEYNDGYDIDMHLNNIYKNMTVVEVTAYSNFFMTVFKAYSIAMLKYSIRELKKDKSIPQETKKFLIERLKEVIALTKNGGCSQWLKE